MRSNRPPDPPSGLPPALPPDWRPDLPPQRPPEPRPALPPKFGPARQAAPAAEGAPFIALVGLSARMLAQSARRAGLRAVALDLFGDRDTRRASKLWIDIGDSQAMAIDRDRLAEALGRVAALPRMMGWIGTSGSETLVPEMVAMAGLPRHLGNDVQAIAAVRDPRLFFPLLDSLRIDHPAIAFQPPATPAGWLYKHRDGCGGWHIRPASAVPAPVWMPASASASASVPPPAWARSGAACSSVPEGGYFQRLAPGRSLSALFVAARGQALRIGAAEQTSVALGACLFVYSGALGPLELAPRVVQRLDAAIAAIVARTGLVGLNSIDCLLDGDTLQVLEINPRPSATLGLYEEAGAIAWPAGLLAIHLDACVHGELPRSLPRYGDWRVGARTVFAPHAFVASASFSNACIMDAGIRDVPMPGTRIAAGQPVCTALARANSLPALREALERRAARLLQQIAHSHENRDDIVQFPG